MGKYPSVSIACHRVLQRAWEAGVTSPDALCRAAGYTIEVVNNWLRHHQPQVFNDPRPLPWQPLPSDGTLGAALQAIAAADRASVQYCETGQGDHLEVAIVHLRHALRHCETVRAHPPAWQKIQPHAVAS